MGGHYQLSFATVVLIVIVGLLIVCITPVQALSAPLSPDKPAYIFNTIAGSSPSERYNCNALSAVPQITGISPATASAGTMTEVTISGTGFGSTPGSVSFYHDTTSRAPGYVTSWSDTLIKVIVPPVMLEGYTLSASSGPVTVTTAEGAASEGYPFAVTFAWLSTRWPGENPVIDFYVNPNTPDCGGEEIAVQNAAVTWNAAPDKSFTFRYAGTTTYTGSPDGGNPNGVNDIYWRDLGVGSVAICYGWGSEGFMEETDIEFNAHYLWSTSDNTPSGYCDVQSTALHEFGHWLDLANLYGAVEGCPQDTSKVMFSSISTAGRNLSADDIAGMQWAYPSSSQSQYTINAAAGIGGNITPSGSVQVDRETDQTFTITPAPGYVIDKVLIDNYTQVTSPSYTFNNIANNHTILATFVASTPTTATFGLDSGNGNYNQFGDALQAMRFENTAGTGTLTMLELLVDDTTPDGKVIMGVYTDDNGKPGALLLDAGEVNVKNGWVAKGNLKLEVTEGKYYWLAFNLDSQNVIRDQSDQAANSHYRVNGYPYGALPSAFPPGALTNNGQFIMRATVTLGPVIIPPTVTSGVATGITDTFAILNGEMADKGSASSVSCSFVWGTTPGGPYTNETNPALTMPETGPFSFSLTGLSPDTEYFYKARAAGDGLSHGDEFSFKTDKESPPVLWEKNYGSDDYDWGNSVLSTSDGGYLITATKYRDSAGYSDVWVIKTDSSGNSQWDQTFGTLWGDYGVSAVQTADNGYVIGYYSYPGDWDVREFSLVKIDSEGNKQWEKAVDATADDAGQAFIQTDDGGYAIVGSYGDLFLDNNGELLLIKTNSSGDILWYKTFDGPEPGDFGYSVIEAADGGYVIAGASGGDEWLIKTDNSGNLQWNKTFSDMGAGLAIIPANEGGYIIAGNNWLQKTDLNGNEQWRKNLNQSDVHYSISIRPTSDGGYIITGNNWLLKTDVNGNEQWNKTLAGRKERVGNSLIQTADGSYVVTGRVLPAGATRSDVYLAKIEGDIEAAANISVGLQGGSRPDGGWVVPLTVKFFTPGADVLNETPLYTFDLATTKSGSVAVASCAGIAPGDYDITVVSPHTLMNVRRDVSVTLPEVQVFMETLLEGDANNDGLIDIRDFGLLSGSYLQASINPMVDFDRNGIVNIQDFALLSANYSKLSPIEVR